MSALGLHNQGDSVSFVSNPTTGSVSTHTLCGWFRPKGVLSAAAVLLNCSGFYSARLNTNDTLYFYTQGGSSGGTYILTTSTIYKNAPFFVVLRRTDSLMEIFVNNILVGSGSFSNNNPRNLQLSDIGTNFKGLIRGVRLFNTSVSNARLTEIYNAGFSAVGTDEAGLVAGYNCNEGTGSTLTDFSSSGKNGTINNPNSVYSNWFDETRTAPQDFYVTSDGSISNNGTDTGNGWSLDYALSHPPDIVDGDTIYLDADTYQPSGFLISRLRSSSIDTPIVVRSTEPLGTFPTPIRIDGVNLTGNGTILTILSENTAYWDIETFNSNPDRLSSQSSSQPTDINKISGIDYEGVGNKLYFAHVRDNSSTGFTFFDADGTNYVFGLLNYNNGWDAPDRRHGHGVYNHNGNASVYQYFNDIITFNNYYYNIQQYNAQSEDWSYNVSYSGVHAANSEGLGIVGSGQKHNFALNNVNAYKSNIELGYSSEKNNDITVAQIITAEQPGTVAFRPRNWNALTLTDSKIIVSNLNSNINSIGKKADGTLGSHNFSNNAYYHGTDTYLPQAFRITNESNALDSYKTFAEWQALGYDTDSTFQSGEPTTNEILVYPQDYLAGRGIVVVWNWEDSASVSVDLSDLDLSNGQAYSIYNAMNPNAGTFDTGVFDTGSPNHTLSMTSNGVADWTNDEGNTPADTLPNFGIFLVIPNEAASGTPDTPISPNVSVSSNTEATFTWTLGAGTPLAVVFQYRYEDEGSWTELVLAADATETTVTGLSPSGSKNLQYRVKTRNVSGDSAFTTTKEKRHTQVKYLGDTRPNVS